MSIEAWIALATLSFAIGTSIVALAMKIAALQADGRNRDEWIKSEVQERKDGDTTLEAMINHEHDDRVKRDSDLLDEIKANEKRIQRWERRQIEMGYKPKPPHDSDEDEGDA